MKHFLEAALLGQGQLVFIAGPPESVIGWQSHFDHYNLLP